MKVLKIGVYSVMSFAVLVAAFGLYLAVAQGTDAQQKRGTLVVAVMALVITVLKVVIDAFIGPEDQLIRDRMKRHEERVESAAAEISGYFGMLGNQLLEQLVSVWDARDWEGLKDRAGYMSSMAEKCWQLAEPAHDKLEILLGIIYVEALELSDRAEALGGVPANQWDEHELAVHFRHVVSYYPMVEDRLSEILNPQ